VQVIFDFGSQEPYSQERIDFRIYILDEAHSASQIKNDARDLYGALPRACQSGLKTQYRHGK
jgi:hypothetical protein